MIDPALSGRVGSRAQLLGFSLTRASSTVAIQTLMFGQELSRHS